MSQVETLSKSDSLEFLLIKTHRIDSHDQRLNTMLGLDSHLCGFLVIAEVGSMVDIAFLEVKEFVATIILADKRDAILRGCGVNGTNGLVRPLLLSGALAADDIFIAHLYIAAEILLNGGKVDIHAASGIEVAGFDGDINVGALELEGDDAVLTDSDIGICLDDMLAIAMDSAGKFGYHGRVAGE